LTVDAVCLRVRRVAGVIERGIRRRAVEASARTARSGPKRERPKTHQEVGKDDWIDALSCEAAAARGRPATEGASPLTLQNAATAKLRATLSKRKQKKEVKKKLRETKN
jgi:hypothetical protein